MTDQRDGDDVPTHDCPIQGTGTPLSRKLDIDTGLLDDWICIWCELAEHMRGGAA